MPYNPQYLQRTNTTLVLLHVAFSLPLLTYYFPYFDAGLQHFGEPEITELDVITVVLHREQQVLRLQVQMHDVLLVEERHPIQNLLHHLPRLVLLQTLAVVQDVLEFAAGGQLQHQHHLRRRLVHLVQADHSVRRGTLHQHRDLVDDLLHLVLVAAALLHELGGVLDAGLFVDGSTDGSILAPAERTDTVKKIIIIQTVSR